MGVFKQKQDVVYVHAPRKVLRRMIRPRAPGWPHNKKRTDSEISKSAMAIFNLLFARHLFNKRKAVI